MKPLSQYTCDSTPPVLRYTGSDLLVWLLPCTELAFCDLFVHFSYFVSVISSDKLDLKIIFLGSKVLVHFLSTSSCSAVKSIKWLILSLIMTEPPNKKVLDS